MKRIISKIFCNPEERSIKRDSHLHFLRESITDTCLLSSLDRLSFLSGKRTSIRAYPMDPRDSDRSVFKYLESQLQDFSLPGYNRVHDETLLAVYFRFFHAPCFQWILVLNISNRGKLAS